MYLKKITLTALADVTYGLEYYNAISDNLGFKFAQEVDEAIDSITKTPNAYSFKYIKEQIRGKNLNSFPYYVAYLVNDQERIVIIFRIFNTHQDQKKITNYS